MANHTRTLLFSPAIARKMLPANCQALQRTDIEVAQAVTDICDDVLEDRGHTRESGSGEEQLSLMQHAGITELQHAKFCSVCT